MLKLSLDIWLTLLNFLSMESILLLILSNCSTVAYLLKRSLTCFSDNPGEGNVMASILFEIRIYSAKYNQTEFSKYKNKIYLEVNN